MFEKVKTTIGTNRALVWVLAGLLLLTGALAAAEPRMFELRLANGALSLEQDSIRVTEGDQVTLKWSSDLPVQLHLHGYDIKQSAGPEKPGAMTFEAYATGRFPISIHGGDGHDHKPVLYLEVYPR